jgi:hypothetical protein
MKLIKNLQGRVTKFVKKRGGTLPKIFVWIYACIFIGCGLLTICGVLFEFFTHGSLNYKAVNDCIDKYFSPSVAATMGVIGVLLIDRDMDGVPDQWQKDKEDKKDEIR